MSFDTFTFTPPTPVLTDSATNLIFDSTYAMSGRAPSTTVVGPNRGRFARYRIGGYISCSTQNVTLRLDYLTSAGAWDSSPAVSATVTAGTPLPFDYLPIAADWRLVEVNGGTGPSALTFNGIFLSDNPNPGV
jgi:hypothetical protein